MHHRFETSQWIAAPVESVFAFFANPENLPPLMPAWQQAEIARASIVAPQLSQFMQPALGSIAGSGSELLIRFRPFPFAPFRLSWLARITEFTWNDRFCDEQVTGPFVYWRHCHKVMAETRDGQPGTRIQDEVEYALPLGWAGNIAQKLFFARQIQATFAYRQQRLAELLKRQ